RVDAAKRGPLGEAWKDRVASVEAAVARVAGTYVLAAGEAKARVGKSLTLRTREFGAKPFPVTVVDVAGDRLAYTRGGVPAAARPEYERAASLAPFLPAPLLRLGEIALADGRLEDAFAAFTKAKTLGASGPDLLHGLARASAARGDDEALAAWRTFLASVPP